MDLMRLIQRSLAIAAAVVAVVTLSFQVSATESTENELTLDWGEWDQSIMEVDIYTLPLTPLQHEILNSKINQLKQKYGVGIVGEIEQAISQMDSSNLLNESNLSDSDKLETQNPLIKDDLLLEEEIKALEFAKSIQREDPEGLSGKTPKSQELFNKILRQLEQLEQKTSTKKVQ